MSTLALAAAPHDLGLTAEEKAWVAAHPVIRVHNETDRPPVNFIRDGKPIGYSIDYMNMLAGWIGLKVEYVPGANWDNFLDMARKGELDVMLNIKETPERAKFLNFTPPYLTQVSTIVSTKSNAFASLDSLKGKRVVTVKGYFYESWIKKQPDITLLYCDFPKHCLEMVAFGQADASFNSLGQADYLIRNEGFGNLHYVAAINAEGFRSTLAMASRKDLPILRDILSKAIARVTPEEENALQRKWLLGQTALPAQARLSTVQREYLKAKQEIRMCSAPATPPLAETLADGTHRGIVPELMAKFSAAINTPVILVPTKTWAESIQFTKDRRCDILAFAQETPERKSFLDFTRPYASFPYVIVTRNTETYIADLATHPGAKLGVTKGHAMSALLKAKYPAAVIVEVKDTMEGLHQVQEGRLFALINSLPIVAHAMQSHGFVDLKISGQLEEKQDIAVAARNDEPMLREVFQAAIDSVPQDERQQIINRWLSIRFDRAIDYSMAWKVFLVGVFLLLVVLYWNWKLRMLNSSISAARQAADAAMLKLEASNREITKLSRTDPLTQLANRIHLDHVLEENVQRAHRYATPFAIILLDLDHFKQVNDKHGHLVGDEVLVDIAKILSADTRNVDTVGRWGGEEFLIVAPNSTLGDAARLAEKLRSEIETHNFPVVGQMTASFGVTEFLPGDDVVKMINRADIALYAVKHSGRNRVESDKCGCVNSE